MTRHARRYVVVAAPCIWTSALDVIPLAADFSVPDRETWAALVEKTLKGGPAESLTWLNPDGLPVEALYTRAPTQPDAVRFTSHDGQAEGRWDLRTVVDHPDPDVANDRALQDLENGASSLLLRLDPSGEDGIAVGSPQDMGRLLAGVELDLAPVALDAGFAGPCAGEWLHVVGRSAPRARLALHMDPLSAFARTGASPGPIDSHVAEAARLAGRLRETYPAATLFLASGAVVHEAGGTAAQELAVMLAAALAYVRALDAAAVGPAEGLAVVTLGLVADAEYFDTVAKLRAARALWLRLCGGLGARLPARIEARSSRRMMSRLDPWVNLLRLTAAGFGAAVGGADAVVLEPFTQPLGRPTDFARRQARNAQLVLMEEAGLARVADPAGGAWFLEAQTDQLARAAWALFQGIEARGGLAQALQDGLIQGWVAKARDALAAELGSGGRKLVGTSVYRNPQEEAVAIDPIDPGPFAVASPDVRLPGPDSYCPPLAAWRAAAAFETAPGAAS